MLTYTGWRSPAQRRQADSGPCAHRGFGLGAYLHLSALIPCSRQPASPRRGHAVGAGRLIPGLGHLDHGDYAGIHASRLPIHATRGDPAQGTLENFAWVCPADGLGDYSLQGSLTFIGAAATEVATIPPLAFTVAAARTRMASLEVSRRGARTIVRGTADAGPGPAGGVLVVSVRTPGSHAWVNLAVPPIRASGAFTATIWVPLATGAAIRAQVRPCRWCAGAQQLARISY